MDKEIVALDGDQSVSGATQNGQLSSVWGCRLPVGDLFDAVAQQRPWAVGVHRENPKGRQGVPAAFERIEPGRCR